MATASGCSESTANMVVAIPLVIPLGWSVSVLCSLLITGRIQSTPRSFDPVVNVIHYVTCSVLPLIIAPILIYMPFRCRGHDGFVIWLVIALLVMICFISSLPDLVRGLLKGPDIKGKGDMELAPSPSQ